MLRRLSFSMVLLIMAASCGAGPIMRRSFRTSDGVNLSYLEAGHEYAGKKPLAIALVPGWSMPAAIWRQQLEALGQNYHTLALDPRGQGESDVPATGYTAERRATDLKEFLELFPNILLVGWSLGGIESLQYIHMYGAARLAGLVPVDSSVGEEPAPPPGGTFKQRLREDRDKVLHEFMRAIFAKPRSEEEISELVRGAKRMALEDSLALLDYPFERLHWRRITRAFKKPLLYAVTPQFAAQAANLKKNRPATEVQVFKAAGHALFVDQPERFNRSIEDFAKSLAR
ncbi:MAG: alpha/beta hydrolase [Deltaproteobacteria bacterium]|nr:MAG: alpha/beta hydrolase [Deltaproteobacteria bacterium]